MIDLQQPLDLDDPEAGAFLDGIQGNILRRHGRDFARTLLLRMSGDAGAARRWIATFAAERVTSAGAAVRQAQAWREAGGPGEPFAMFALAPTVPRARLHRRAAAHAGRPVQPPVRRAVLPARHEGPGHDRAAAGQRPRRVRAGSRPTSRRSTRWCCWPTTTRSGCDRPSPR